MSTPEKLTNETAGKKKHRSPGYPVVSIDEAIARLRLIYQKDKRAFTSLNAILAHMGFKNTAGRSGRAGRVVSALKQYGLLEEKAGQFKVSDLGFRILYLPGESDERASLVKEAALNPPIFPKLLSHYNGEIPSDEALRSHLVFQEGFNPDTVDEFIRVFRTIIEIAKPTPSDYNIGEESEGADQPTGGMPPMQQPPARMAAQQTPPKAQLQTLQGQPLEYRKATELAFKLSRDSEARITIYGDATQEAIEKLAALLELQKDTFPTKAELEQPKAEKQRTDVGQLFDEEPETLSPGRRAMALDDDKI